MAPAPDLYGVKQPIASSRTRKESTFCGGDLQTFVERGIVGLPAAAASLTPLNKVLLKASVQRQNDITEELLDAVSGAEALSQP